MNLFQKKVLFIGDLNLNGAIYLRSESMRKIIDSVDTINTIKYINPNQRLSYSLAYRFQPKILLKKLNDNILKKINLESYDLIWFDKPIFILKSTLKTIDEKGIPMVCLNPDNPFGPRNDGCWNLYLKNINLYSHHIIFRRSNYKDLRELGIKNIHFMPFCYDENIHYKESGIEKIFDVTFIGTPHDERVDFINNLSKRIDSKIHIFTSKTKIFNQKLRDNDNVIIRDAVYNADYRKVINQSRIMLGFYTKQNIDELSHRSFEITACGSFYLGERNSFQKRFFREGVEADYFDNEGECADKISHYLSQPIERKKIEAVGHDRVHKLRMHNSYLIERALNWIFMNNYPMTKL